jgi:ABC-type molybdate transport system permease subunit
MVLCLSKFNTSSRTLAVVPERFQAAQTDWPAIVAFRRLDPSLLAVARTLGASPPRRFFQVALRLAKPALIAGAAMSWARALGEFGATLMFAGNLTGKTQTLPLARA